MADENTVLMSKEARLNMERCAEFMARIIQKYGDKVLKKIEKQEMSESVQTDESEMTL